MSPSASLRAASGQCCWIDMASFSWLLCSMLGTNGAGKSTVLNCLTGDDTPSSGSAFIEGRLSPTRLPLTCGLVAGYDCVKQRRQTQLLVGYCPQDDPLLDLMTGRQHLNM